jgi:hypothetical protein
MTEILNKRKQQRIRELVNNYNNNIKQTRTNYARLILNVSKSRNKQKVKKILVKQLQNSLNNALNNLKNNLNNDISSVNQLTLPTIQPGNNKNALVIGINYTGTENQLNGCINDANNINDLLLSAGFKYISVLTDNSSKTPTRDNIINEFINLLSNSNSGDTLFLFYSGHGSYMNDNNGNEITKYDQLILPCDLNWIVDDELKNIIQTNLKPNVNLISLFDSCFSESVLDLRFQYQDSLFNNNDNENERESETNGNVIMISGCSDIQTSEDAVINNINQGALTWAFLQIFNSNPSQTWRQLLNGMRDLLKNNGFTQIPQLSSGKLMNIDAKVFI